VVQRVPVRITIDTEQLVKNPLRVGLSMDATVDVRNQDGKMLADHKGGNDDNHFQNFVMFTNYQFYVDAFVQLSQQRLASGEGGVDAFAQVFGRTLGRLDFELDHHRLGLAERDRLEPIGAGQLVLPLRRDGLVVEEREGRSGLMRPHHAAVVGQEVRVLLEIAARLPSRWRVARAVLRAGGIDGRRIGALLGGLLRDLPGRRDRQRVIDPQRRCNDLAKARKLLRQLPDPPRRRGLRFVVPAVRLAPHAYS